MWLIPQSDKLREVTPVVFNLNEIAGISVKDKLGGKKKRQRKGKVMARKIK